MSSRPKDFRDWLTSAAFRAASQAATQAASEVQRRFPQAWPQMQVYLESGLKNPEQTTRLLGQWLEEVSPWLSRQALGAASNLSEPFVAGMGLSVERLDDDGITCVLPNRWRNQGLQGEIHHGAIAALAEACFRIFWNRHLGGSAAPVDIRCIQSRFHSKSRGELRATLKTSESEVEALLFRLRSEGQVEWTSLIQIFDEEARLAAEVSVEAKVERRAELSGSTS